MRFELFHNLNERFLRDFTPVDLDALCKINQVRRGIKTHPVPGSLQRAGNQRRGGTLAFGSGHMDHRILILRISQPLHQCAHPFKVKFFRQIAQITGQAVIHKAVKIIKGFLVISVQVGHVESCKIINEGLY